MLVEVAPDIWTAEDMLALPGGVKLPIRMTLCRLPRGGLFVHSPLPLSDPLLMAVARIDAVEYLVAPNRLHHRFAGQWMQRFAGAKLYGAEGLARKRKDLRFAGVLGQGEAPWASVLDQTLVAGAPGVNETVFLHRPSRSLLVTDLLFNVREPANFVTGLVLRVMGTRGRLAMSRAWRRYTRDREALKASLENVLAWDFTRILPGHGAIHESPDAPRDARAAMAWAVRESRARPSGVHVRRT
jgi:hypothetical protein